MCDAIYKQSISLLRLLLTEKMLRNGWELNSTVVFCLHLHSGGGLHILHVCTGFLEELPHAVKQTGFSNFPVMDCHPFQGVPALYPILPAIEFTQDKEWKT